MMTASGHHFSSSPGGGRAAHQPRPGLADLSIRQIATPNERRAAEHLVRRMYSWRGYRTTTMDAKPNHSGRVTLGAWQRGELAATLTLSIDNGRGLLCEALYPTEIAALRRDRQRLCECSQFAIDPDFSSPVLLRSFFRNAYYQACLVLNASHAVIEVNPRHSRFYERELGFGRLGAMRICPRVSAPALLLHRDLRKPLPEMLAASHTPAESTRIAA
jgi:hypothetical protein